MAIELKTPKKGVIHLAIRDEMSIYTVREQQKQLAAYLKSAQEVQIDLGGVTEIDSAGVQLLMYLKREADSHRVKLSLTQHSEPVVEALELLNLSKHFGDPIVISADWKSS